MGPSHYVHGTLNTKAWSCFRTQVLRVAHIALGENVNINRLHEKSVQDQHLQGQYKQQPIHSDMQLHHPRELTGKENSNLHGCEVSLGCQQFRERIEIFKLTGDVLLNFISQCLCVTFSSRSVHFTDWNAQTFVHFKGTDRHYEFFFFFRKSSVRTF